MPSISSGGIGSVRGSAQLGKKAKTRQKIREIDGFILKPQQFHKFSIQNSRNAMTGNEHYVYLLKLARSKLVKSLLSSELIFGGFSNLKPLCSVMSVKL